MTTTSISSDLFTVTAHSGYVAVTPGTATLQQLAALGTLFERTSDLVSIYEVRPNGGFWPKSLRINSGRVEKVVSFLANLQAEAFEAEVTRLTRGKEKIIARDEFETRVAEMSLFDFGQMFCKRTNGKLAFKLHQPDFVVTAAELLPVTHFKSLARATKYNGSRREFSAKHLSKDERADLLQLADKIGKSKKKVTRADIAARRERLRAKHAADIAPRDADFWEAAEDFGWEQALEWMRDGKLSEPASDIWKYE